MAKTIEIFEPAYVTLTNLTDKPVKFVPYKENFNTTLGAKQSIEILVSTAGQVCYYMQQANANLKVEQSESDTGAPTFKIIVPATITIKNNSQKVMNFIPYRESFQQPVTPGDTFKLIAKTAGCVLYYLAQDVDGQLDVTQEPAHEATAILKQQTVKA